MSAFAQTHLQKECESDGPDPTRSHRHARCPDYAGSGTGRHKAMAKVQADHDLRSNRLLGALEPASRKRIDPHLEPISFKLGDMVCDAGGLLKHAYFPQGSVLSLLTVLENGAAIETANIGREGGFGLFAAMYSRVSFNRCIVQLEGHTVRCPIELLQAEFKNSEHVRDLFVSYSETPAFASPTDRRMQFDAHDGRADVPLASDDA